MPDARTPIEKMIDDACGVDTPDTSLTLDERRAYRLRKTGDAAKAWYLARGPRRRAFAEGRLRIAIKKLIDLGW
jgi:hypothetical protein